MQKITPFLWFNDNAEEALDFYTSVFKNSKKGMVSRYTEGMPGEKGSFMTGTMELEGQQFMLLNGGPQFSFTPAISFFVKCADQAEIDYYWEKLSEGGATEMCGWLKDKFGVSWQIVPEMLEKILHGGDRAKSSKAMQAMMNMKKLEIAGLEEAYAKG
jgi:predicted 3-demethylubiquinone-9 3-methyltransferase (glyoxalase superfamily)